VARQLTQAGEHGIGDRVGHLRDATRDLGHEERVAAGDAHGLVRVQAAALGELGDRGRAERIEMDAVRGLRRQRADHAAQRVVGAELVLTEGHHQHGGQRTDPSTDVADHIERRLVRPVGILDDDRGHTQRIAHQLQHALEHGCGVRGRDRVGERAARHPGDVPQRPERAAGQEVITPPTSGRVVGPGSATHASTRDDLPMPASPETSTTPPRPCDADPATARSTARSPSRSNNPLMVSRRCGATPQRALPPRPS
jgi:hypothetical protein